MNFDISLESLHRHPTLIFKLMPHKTLINNLLINIYFNTTLSFHKIKVKTAFKKFGYLSFKK